MTAKVPNDVARCPHCGHDDSKNNGTRQGRDQTIYRRVCRRCRRGFQCFSSGQVVSLKVANDSLIDSIEDEGTQKTTSLTGVQVVPTEKYMRQVFEIPDDWIVAPGQGIRTNVWAAGEKQMHHGRMTFVPKVPELQDWPAVQPVKLKPLDMQRAREAGPAIRRAIVCGDAQVGFFRDFDTYQTSALQDMRAFALLNAAIMDIKPDLLVLDGDMLDLPDWSDHFVQGPEFAFTTQLSINWFASWLRAIRPYVGRLVYLYGNHEARLSRNVVNNTVAAYRLKPANMPAAPPVLSIENLLGLTALDVEYIPAYPQGEFYINDNLKVIHGTKIGAKSGQTVMKMLDGVRCSVIQGHVHRQEAAHVTTHSRGKTVTYGAYSLGCLARIDGVVPGSKGRDNWQQGFAVVEYSDRLFHVDQVNIFGERMICNGTAYETAENNLPLSEDLIKTLLSGAAGPRDVCIS